MSQDLCAVCAVSNGHVHRLASALRPAPRVLSLRARDLEGIWSALHEGPSARVLCIEWLEPLYVAGHWVPELVAAAGGKDVGSAAGSHSTRREWRELGRLQPDHILVMLCGFGVGNAYTSRAGPRVVDGAGQIHAAITNGAFHGIQQWQPAGVC
jgi:iron complex transport system substrate-binding protein